MLHLVAAKLVSSELQAELGVGPLSHSLSRSPSST
jgi:hypothetical protein